MKRSTTPTLGLFVLLLTPPALAVDASVPDAAAFDAPSDLGVADGALPEATVETPDAVAPEDSGTDVIEKVWTSCIEHLPAGATKPTFKETFPERGLTGHALPLTITIEHGRGETVLPNGLQIQSTSDAARAIHEAGLFLPSPDGGSAPSLSSRVEGDRSITEVIISFVALPPTPGRHQLELPPIPIAISRASGELITLCTAAHRVTLEDPIANTPSASPKANPPPRPQRELWTQARDLTYGLLVGAAIAAILTFLVLKWLRRPRPVPPPPPPRPPWEVALEQLDALKRSAMLEDGQSSEYVDRVSDIARQYLGALYGFDGIESTTDEVLTALGVASPPAQVMERVRHLLEDCDLVKFARMTPTPEDCVDIAVLAETVVRSTMPTTVPPERAPESPTPKEPEP